MRILGLILLLTSTPVLAADTEDGCAAMAGRKYANMLADQCRMVSPATYPPCSTENSCDMILEEVRRGCVMLAGDTEPVPADAAALHDPQTAFCKNIVEIAGEAKPSFDCAKATSNAEKTICSNNELAEWDVAVAEIYERGLRSETTTAEEQRKWLRARDKTCTELNNVPCLKTALKARWDALRLSERGMTPNANARGLKYADLIGTWESKAIRLFDDAGITSIGYDDDKYRDMTVVFSEDKIEWTKGTERSPLDPSDNCTAPKLTAILESETSYKVPDGMQVKCGPEGWGPGDGAVVRRLSKDTVQLFWFDSAILTLKRVK